MTTDLNALNAELLAACQLALKAIDTRISASVEPISDADRAAYEALCAVIAKT